jgi:hypothetical protein
MFAAAPVLSSVGIEASNKEIPLKIFGSVDASGAHRRQHDRRKQHGETYAQETTER